MVEKFIMFEQNKKTKLGNMQEATEYLTNFSKPVKNIMLPNTQFHLILVKINTMNKIIIIIVLL